MAAAAANWSEVPRDILWNVIGRLPMADCIRFGGVCVPWRSTLAEDRCGPASQLPWLMLPCRDGDGTETKDDTVRFFSLTENKDYRMSLPEMCNVQCFGSSEGFLIYADEASELHMLDPISGARVDLPSITTFPQVTDFSRDSQGRINGYMYQYRPHEIISFCDTKYFREVYFGKVIVSPGSTPDSYTVVVMYGFCARKLAFARAGDTAWNLIDTPEHLEFKDAIFHNKLLYALNYQTMVLAINLSHPSPPPIVSLGGLLDDDDRSDPMRYLVVLSSGELLQVRRSVGIFPTEEEEADKKIGVYRTIRVLLHKMDSTSHKWVETKSIGDHALFLGHNRSVSFSTRDFPELKSNCIYFTDDCLDFYLHLAPPHKPDIGVYDIEDGSMKPFYPPDSILNWPLPIWFTPNMTNLSGTEYMDDERCMQLRVD